MKPKRNIWGCFPEDAPAYVVARGFFLAGDVIDHLDHFTVLNKEPERVEGFYVCRSLEDLPERFQVVETRELRVDPLGTSEHIRRRFPKTVEMDRLATDVKALPPKQNAKVHQASRPVEYRRELPRPKIPPRKTVP